MNVVFVTVAAVSPALPKGFGDVSPKSLWAPQSGSPWGGFPHKRWISACEFQHANLHSFALLGSGGSIC